MRVIVRTLASGLIALFSLASAAQAEKVDVTFLLVNDTDKLEADERGGFARLAAVAKSERAKGGHVVLVHAGDAISPSLLSGIDKGAHIISLLNMATVDVFVPGNHEFDFGPDIFRQRMAEARFDTVASNLRAADGALIEGILDHKIMSFGPAKVGFVGLTDVEAREKSSLGDLQLLPETETLSSRAKMLRYNGVDLVVAVVHANRAIDMKLAGRGDADIILSGDDHDLFLRYDGRSVIAEGREQADYIPVIEVSIDVEEAAGTKAVSWRPSFRIIDTATITPDPEIEAMIAAFQAQLSDELDAEIGTAETELDSRRATIRGGEAAIGNLIADAMRAAVGADVAITNGGGIRGDKIYPAGSRLTRRDILTELPFGNKTVMIELTGAQLRTALEQGLSRIAHGSGRFPHVSGLRLKVDPSRPAGSRIVEISAAGAPLEEDATYKVATNDFMARGGDGFTSLTQGKALVDAMSGDLMANDVIAYVESAGRIAARTEGRIQFDQP